MTGLDTPIATIYDAIIVGGGPAGLSAALVLGRCRRKVVLCDGGRPRNWASHGVHGFLTRDGMDPHELRATARRQLEPYDTVRVRDVEVVDVRRIDQGSGAGAGASETGEGLARFAVETADGDVLHTRTLLLATGLVDQLPDVEGFADLFGYSVFQCPYCDGWEMRGMPLAVYGCGERGLEMARALTAWTDDIVLCTDGPCELAERHLADLAANGIAVVETKLRRLEARDGRVLEAIVFEDGTRLARRAVFFDTPAQQQSALAAALGCEFDERGGVVCDRYEATKVPGLHVAGNALKDVQLAVVAAAEGAKAAFGINRELARLDFQRRAAAFAATAAACSIPPDRLGRTGGVEREAAPP